MIPIWILTKAARRRRQLFLKTLKTVFKNRLRAALTIAGIAVGVASVVMVSAVGEVGKTQIGSQMSGMGMDNLVITAQENGATILSAENLADIKAEDGVNNAMPLMNRVTYGEILGKNRQIMLWGINEDAGEVIDLDVIHGRMINPGDINTENNVCIIDESIAESSYHRSNIVGKKVSISFSGVTREFEVVGVVKSGVNALQSMLGGFVPEFIYIPYTVMQSELGKTTFDTITVKVDSAEKGDTVAAIIETKLSKSHTSAAVSVDNLIKQKDNMTDIVGTASLALSAVAGISLLVAGTSVMTVMLVSVSERTREIGIKKSIGASDFNILAEFLAESVFLTLTGAAAGLAGGIAIAYALCLAVGVPFAVNPVMCLAAAGVAVAIGAVFGVYPAYRAARLRPVEALRAE
jgi:putative ABC transport system permease protein